MSGFNLDDFLHYFGGVRQRTRRVAELIPADRGEWALAGLQDGSTGRASNRSSVAAS